MNVTSNTMSSIYGGTDISASFWSNEMVFVESPVLLSLIIN